MPDAPVLVLLHAFPLSARLFDRLTQELGAVAPQRRVLAIDLPGLGRAAWSGEPSVAAMASLVADRLDDDGVERAVVLGISTGGYVALELAAARPELVAGLVLGSTTPRVMEPDVPADRLQLAADLERTGDLGLVGDSADDGLGPTAHAEQPGLREELLGIIGASDPAGVAWVARALAARRDTSHVLARLGVPVMLVGGAEDTSTPGERLEEMAALRVGLPDEVTRCHVLPATGHLTVLERPAEVAALLAEFVDAVVGE